jgi:hypothetical protein
MRTELSQTTGSLSFIIPKSVNMIEEIGLAPVPSPNLTHNSFSYEENLPYFSGILCYCILSQNNV